jgi:hypothetical protein
MFQFFKIEKPNGMPDQIGMQNYLMLKALLKMLMFKMGNQAW